VNSINLKQVEYLMAHMANQSGLSIDNEIRVLTNSTMTDVYEYMDTYPDTVDYIVVLCYS
jgi:hypothetical protein